MFIKKCNLFNKHLYKSNNTCNVFTYINFWKKLFKLAIILIIIVLGFSQYFKSKKNITFHNHISLKNFKRTNLKFNHNVNEDENIGGEEIELNAQSNSISKDLNAANEVNSKELLQNENILSLDDKSIFYVWNREYLENKGIWNYRNFTEQEINSLSTLGRRLFLHENIGKVENNKIFLINVYKYGKKLEKRLIYQYTSNKHDPFEKCSVKNCKISYENSDFHTADAVLFHLHTMESAPINIHRKNFDQFWVWMSDESVYNTFTLAKDKILDHYNGLFNWSMTYRSSSDVPVPYGRTVPLIHTNNNKWDIFSTKNKTVAIMGSNCGGRNKRWDFVKSLKKFIDVDTYGRCGAKKCFGHFNRDCPNLSNYKFYLSYENANCLEYITEKLWWNAFEKFAVPIVMGPLKRDYIKLLPPNSFIYAEDFRTPKNLAKYLLYLSSNKTAYNSFHEWRKSFKILNEHGYFQTDVFHYCRLCEALNYNSHNKKMYHSMKDFWNVKRDCYPFTWTEN